MPLSSSGVLERRELCASLEGSIVQAELLEGLDTEERRVGVCLLICERDLASAV